MRIVNRQAGGAQEGEGRDRESNCSDLAETEQIIILNITETLLRNICEAYRTRSQG